MARAYDRFQLQVVATARRRSLFWRVTIGFALVSFVQCGATTDDVPGRVPETPSEAALELAEAQSGYLERCDPDALYAFGGASREACVDYFACRGVPRGLMLDTSEAVFNACVEFLGARDCPRVEEQPYARFSNTVL